MKYPFTVLGLLLAVASWPVYADDKEDHLACYEINGGKKADKWVKIKDQFFPNPAKKTKVLDAVLLCDPAKKELVNQYAPTLEDDYNPVAKESDVFKCYEVDPKRLAPNNKKQVDLKDQFDRKDYVVVKKLKYLCTPAKKTHKKD